MAYLTSGYQVRTAQIGRQAHPDVLANILSQDAVGAVLDKDPSARADINATIGNKIILISGQIRSFDAPSGRELGRLARSTIREVGYNGSNGYELPSTDPDGIQKRKIVIDVNSQSPNISEAVGNGGAGDTIIKHGYAVKGGPNYLPFEHVLVREMANKLDDYFRQEKIQGLGPDGKLNIGLKYEKGKPKYAAYVVVAAQHAEGTNLDIFRERILNEVVIPTLGNFYNPAYTRIIINGAGLFDHAGPVIDRGIKGKKDADSTYGDHARHTGGSAFGKDPSKADFQGLVGARYIAKNLVANGVFDEGEVKLGYAIGHDEPVVLDFDVRGHKPRGIEALVRRNFPLSPKEMMQELDLKNPALYPATARQHFFGNPDFPWEQIKKLA
ncbi:methionine adenosyltransferase domain-containing protein [Candidatus Woesearchaeota archaeon]|nr:methionine adenosyltransferase domain-containing protein [Candidatus Woesearchaeota archaeon]